MTKLDCDLTRELVFQLRKDGKSNNEILNLPESVSDVLKLDSKKIKIELERYDLIKQYEQEKQNTGNFYRQIKDKVSSFTSEKLEKIISEDSSITNSGKPYDIIATSFYKNEKKYFDLNVSWISNLVNSLDRGLNFECLNCNYNALELRIAPITKVIKKGNLLFSEKQKIPLFAYCPTCGIFYEPFFADNGDLIKIN